ncbi:MAG: hypothetical protein LBC74_16395 [Planctomycetaceae bacterium]|jgi:hypothetical protein|nr:hypothetical protein [Planctomycetaceae bacterium]
MLQFFCSKIPRNPAAPPTPRQFRTKTIHHLSTEVSFTPIVTLENKKQGMARIAILRLSSKIPAF